ncbi:MAG: MGMT family protein [Chloroflexota bacterium]|nr:MGMT family protein [Chloroflexota bacterium]
MIKERQLVEDLRALGQVHAPATLVDRVLDRLALGDEYALLDTLLGPLYVAWNREGISAVMRAPEPDIFEQRFRARFGRSLRRAREVPCDLGDRFDLRGLTEFERAVLLKAREIPRGEIRTYGWIASEIGRPAAVRAVGSALRKNPVPVFIPCHRVVRSDGYLGDYALGGNSAKRAILSAEGVEPDELERLAQAHIRFIGNRATGVFCFTTCQVVRRSGRDDRVLFRSRAAASAADFRPCSACRPARSA